MFRQYYDRIKEKNAQVLGISCDSVASHRAWSTALGGLPYPELSDFHPKGKASQAFDLWNEDRGTSNRAVIVVDKEGVIRYRQTYVPGVLPDPADILGELDKIG